ncbi:MAG: hypothetical protein JAZ11_02950 [Candidatus Thiodiazotropha lotti]|nr:hypothetical protein [Candidatus Thiodiazotropha lotti]
MASIEVPDLNIPVTKTILVMHEDIGSFSIEDAILSIEALCGSSDDLPVIAWIKREESTLIVRNNSVHKDSQKLFHAEIRCMLDLAVDSAPLPSLHLHTTLEPCAMCVSAAAHFRIEKITYYCRDPVVGSATKCPQQLWYQEHWPSIELNDIYEERIKRLIRQHMSSKGRWAACLELFD